MKKKKLFSILCVVSLLSSMITAPTFAEEFSPESAISSGDIQMENDMVSSDDIQENVEETMVSFEDMNIEEYDDVISVKELAERLAAQSQQDSDDKTISQECLEELNKIVNKEKEDTENFSYKLEQKSIGSLQLNSEAVLMQDISVSNNTRSQNSVTRQFTDYITTDEDQKYVTFSLNQGQILNASLICPNNENLDYALILATVAEDGTVNPIKSCNLGTYIDPITEKTVDEAISYIHTDSTEGEYAIFVVSARGSSTTESFTLTISLDTPSSFDRNEPNDSALEATELPTNASSITGSLHVVNDQDWYGLQLQRGLYNFNAGNYQVELYHAENHPGVGDVLVAQEKTVDGNYFLDRNGYYYCRIYSNATIDDFSFGSYTLQITDPSIYADFNTAFDFGQWETSYSRHPEPIPEGQETALYKFSIDSSDRAYASVLFKSEPEDFFAIEVLDSTGRNTLDFGSNGNATIARRNVIEKENGYISIVANIDGNRVGNTGYLRITRAPNILSSSPAINKRIYTGRGTFKFSGTAKNSGGTNSTILSLDLTNNVSIPEGAIVKSIKTEGNISSQVGNVQHMLNPNREGWITAPISAMPGKATFNIGTEQGIAVKVPWQFRYYQAATKSTEIRNLSMNIDWEYDIANTNYELFH